MIREMLPSQSLLCHFIVFFFTSSSLEVNQFWIILVCFPCLTNTEVKPES